MLRLFCNKCLVRFGGLILATTVLSACSTGLSQLASCQGYSGSFPVEYVGGALGRGKLELGTLPKRSDLLQGSLTLWDDTGTDAVLNLQGPGTCDSGVVHMVFGGGDHPQSRVRIVGGNATLVPAGGKVPQLFGIWNVEARIKATGEQRHLSGYFRQTDS